MAASTDPNADLIGNGIDSEPGRARVVRSAPGGDGYVEITGYDSSGRYSVRSAELVRSDTVQSHHHPGATPGRGGGTTWRRASPKRSTRAKKPEGDVEEAEAHEEVEEKPKDKYPGVPARMSEAFLEQWVPELDVDQARELRDALIAKKWTIRKGSMEDRFYGRLMADVKQVVLAEHEAMLRQGDDGDEEKREENAD